LVFVTVAILLSLVALLAVCMPASHASRLDPRQVLRIE
jgi:ABC-type antimicrobial peptide transport system permease subunit